MRFGVCNGIDKLPLVKQYGFDYIELNFTQLTLADEKEFENYCNQIRRYGIYAESFNCLFPGNVNFNANVDYEMIRNYAEKGFYRAQKLGGKTVAFGSSRARNIPDGYDRNLAVAQFKKVLCICSDVADKYGIQIALEPLNFSETNFINTVADGIDICRSVNQKNVKCLVDFYHVFMNGESLDAIMNSGDMIIHTHLARPNSDRRIPTVADAQACSEWARALKLIGYNGRMSLEGDFGPDFETAIKDVQPILDLFR